MTKRECFLRLMKNDSPNWLGDPWSCFSSGEGDYPPLADDPITALDPVEYGFYKNAWGVTMVYEKGSLGATPYITDETKVVKNIRDWHKYLKAPSLDNLNWQPYENALNNVDRNEYLVMVPSWTGCFEFSHFVMGFEDALCNYMMEQDAMESMLSYYTDWKLESIRLLIDHLQPDIIHSHDDWGHKQGTFLSPDLWRKMIKPHYERLYGYIKSRGVLIQHHADCVCDTLADDMVELGIDMWQGCIPQNDITHILQRTHGKLCLMGGIDMALIDHPHSDEKTIRAEVRRAIDVYAPYGNFMPCISSVWAASPHTDQIIADEMNTYGAKWMSSHKT